MRERELKAGLNYQLMIDKDLLIYNPVKWVIVVKFADCPEG